MTNLKIARLEEIIALEWQMFDRVNNIGGRADCQDDPWAFRVMRLSNFCFLSEATLESYYQDLREAEKAGRNLLTEKYAYMMEYTDPEYYHQVLAPALPEVSAEKSALAEQIAKVLLADEQKFREKYSYADGRGRALTDDAGWTSFYTYLLSELKTYSTDTLRLYQTDVDTVLARGESVSYLIHDEQARLYGHEGVEAVEGMYRETDRRL